MLSSTWITEAMMPAVKENAAVRRYPSSEDLGGVLGALLGVREIEEDLLEEADLETLREAG